MTFLHSTSQLVFIGPSGVGKSLVATRLSQRMNVRMCDLDSEICKLAGVDITWIMDKEGEAGFRQRELAALKRAIDNKIPIISTGAGIVTTPACRELLQSKTLWVVYLSATAELLCERLRHSNNRPLLGTGDDRKARIERMLEERKPFYESLADVEIPINNCTPNDLVNKLLAYVST